MRCLSFLLVLIGILSACNSQEPTNEAYAHVFQPLDGEWLGKFIVYTDTLGQREGNVQPRDINLSSLQNLPLKVSLTIDVWQVYTSESPYFQSVHIIDSYPQPDGSIRKVESRGYNKVEKGKLMCEVNKPDEQVIHSGTSQAGNVIIWQRSLKNPMKIEYFYEVVDTHYYSIVGWGYYGDDNPELSPKTWFYGKYERQ